MKKKVLLVIGVVLVILILVLGIVYLVDLNRMQNNEPVFFSTWGRKYSPPELNTKLDLVLSLEDEIKDNSAWCGTFNLIWNDLKNELAKQDIVFLEGNTKTIDNLNKGTFTVDNLSEESYYKTFGIPSLEYKEQIKEEIKRKFDEDSKILDNFDWENATEYDYILYSMLKKEFEFPKEFIKLETGEFADYSNVKYFGINSDVEEEIRDEFADQVEILYYNSEDSFAIKLTTKQNDEIIIAKGNKAKTFGQMYENIIERAEGYSGPSYLMIQEGLKIPYINFNLNEEITEVENKPFLFANGQEYKILKAMQTIEFDLNEKGGKVKSEAGMYVENLSASYEEPRQFIVDDAFTIFLVEKGKELPYFAANISDISRVQEDVVLPSNEAENNRKIVIEPGALCDTGEFFYSEITESEEIERIENLIYNAEFTKETCDGINEYYITLDNGEGYGIEIYDERVHITAGERGEAVLTEEQSKWLKEILDKYALKNVSMQVKTETLTRTGATVVITDTNENHYGYDQWYRIEQNTYDGWTEVEPITDEYAFTDLGLLVGEDNMLEDKIDWSKLYGELDDGNYRIVKRVYDNGYKYFSVEFTLGDVDIIN